jgi:plasmid stabilization system protein ParE
MADFTLSEFAIEDLEAIYIEGYTNWGKAQADKYQHGLHHQFELLATFPGIGLPLDITGHDFYRFVYGEHIIVYSKAKDGVQIEFIVKGCTDWLSHIRRWTK